MYKYVFCIPFHSISNGKGHGPNLRHALSLRLSGTGAVYGLSLNEANMLLRWHNFSVHMTRKIMSVPQGPLSIRQVQSSQNSALYLSGRQQLHTGRLMYYCQCC